MAQDFDPNSYLTDEGYDSEATSVQDQDPLKSVDFDPSAYLAEEEKSRGEMTASELGITPESIARKRKGVIPEFPSEVTPSFRTSPVLAAIYGSINAQNPLGLLASKIAPNYYPSPAKMADIAGTAIPVGGVRMVGDIANLGSKLGQFATDVSLPGLAYKAATGEKITDFAPYRSRADKMEEFIRKSPEMLQEAMGVNPHDPSHPAFKNPYLYQALEEAPSLAGVPEAKTAIVAPKIYQAAINPFTVSGVEKVAFRQSLKLPSRSKIASTIEKDAETAIPVMSRDAGEAFPKSIAEAKQQTISSMEGVGSEMGRLAEIQKMEKTPLSALEDKLNGLQNIEKHGSLMHTPEAQEALKNQIALYREIFPDGEMSLQFAIAEEQKLNRQLSPNYQAIMAGRPPPTDAETLILKTVRDHFSGETDRIYGAVQGSEGEKLGQQYSSLKRLHTELTRRELELENEAPKNMEKIVKASTDLPTLATMVYAVAHSEPSILALAATYGVGQRVLLQYLRKKFSSDYQINKVFSRMYQKQNTVPKLFPTQIPGKQMGRMTPPELPASEAQVPYDILVEKSAGS